MVAELTSITGVVASNNSHKSASTAGRRSTQLPRWIQTATKPNSHNYSCSSDQLMYSSVAKTTNKHKHENESSGCRYRNDVAETTTDPVGLLSRQGPGRGNVGLVGPYRASCDKLNTMGDREDVEDGGGDPRSDRGGSDGNCVGVSGVGGERRMFILRDEELVEDGEYVHGKARKVSPDDGDVVSDVSPTPGRENWRLRESKNTTGDMGSGIDERRGMSMTDIWPKDWGGKNFVFCCSR